MLLSKIIACMQSKYLPTGDMSAADVWVEIAMANTNDRVTISTFDTTVGAKTSTVSDVELMLEYAEINYEAARIIPSQNARGLCH